MPFRYEQFCPLARAAEILGERWTLLIVRELCCGPQRFSDLRRRLPGLSSSVLTQRLESLAERGLVAREEQPPPAAVALYRLTDEGERLRPVLQELMRFGVRHVEALRPGDHLEPEWIGLVLDAFAHRDAVPRRRFTLVVPDGERELVWHVSGGRQGTRVDLGGDRPAEVRVRLAPLLVLGLLTGQMTPGQVVAAGARVEGDLEALADLPGLFELEQLMSREASTG